MTVHKSPKAIPDLAQNALDHSRDLLFALSRAAQSMQRARAAEDFYHAVGKEITSLGGVVTLLTVNEDHSLLTVVYTSYAKKLLQGIEKTIGKSPIGYSFAVSSDTIYARKLASGNAEYVHWKKEDIVDALPFALRPMTEQIMNAFSIEQSILAPLRVDDETLGLMMVSGLALSEDDVSFIDSFAGQVAAGLQNIHLMQKLQNELSVRAQVEESLNHKSGLLLALSRAAQSIQQARTVDEIYHAVGNQIKSLGGDVTLLMLDEDRYSLTAEYMSYAPGVLRKLEKLSGSPSFGYRIVISPGSVYERDIAAKKAEYVHSAKEHFYEAFPKSLRFLADQFMGILKVEQGILAPLHLDGETLGLMMVSGLALNESDVPAMESFAGQIAAGLQNANLMQKLQDELSARKQAEETLSRNRSLILALGRAAQAVQLVRKPEDIYLVVGEQIKALGFDATILTLDSEQKNLYFSYTTISEKIIRTAEKMSGHVAKGYHWSISPDSIYGRIISSGKSEFIPLTGDIFTEILPKSMHSLSGRFMKMLGIEQGIIAPLHVDEDNFGILLVSGNDTLGTEELPVIDSFAGQVSISLRNARLMQKLEGELSARKQAEESLNHNRNMLLVLSRAAQAVQLVREPEEIYRVMGEQIQALGFEATILMFGSDQKRLHYRYTTLSEKIIRAAEKMVGFKAYEYNWPISPDSIYDRIIKEGKAEYIHSAGELFAEALPSYLRAMSGALIQVLRVGHGILAPLHVGEESFGVLIVFGSDLLSSKDLPAIDSFAGQVSISLRNALLTQQAENELKERNQAEAALRASEAKIHALMDAIPDMMFMLDDDGVFVDYHAAKGRALYVPPEDFLGKNIRDVMPLQMVEIYASKFEEAVKDKESQLFEYVLDMENGPHFFEAHIVSYQGNRILCIVRDITRRKKAEEAVRQAERHFKALIENATDGILVVNAGGTIRYESPSVSRMLGYAPDGLVGMNAFELIHPDDMEEISTAFLQGLTMPGFVHRGEYRLRHSSGEWRYVEIVTQYLLEDSVIAGIIINGRDITERKLTEDALRESESKFHSVISESADGVILADETGRIIEFNNAIEQITGQSSELALGQFLWDFEFRIAPAFLQTDEHYARVKEAVESTLNTGETSFRNNIMESSFQFSDGSIRFIQQRLFSIRTERGWRLGSISRNVTEQKQAEETLHRQYKNLHSLYQMTATLSQTAVIEEVYNAALDSLQSTLLTDRVSILLFDADGVIRFKAWRGLSDAYRKAAEGHSPWKQDAQDPQPVLVPDAQMDASLASLRALFLEEGIGSLGFIPLVYQGRLLGKFMIYFNEPHEFNTEEIQLAETIARHVAFAIFRQQTEKALRASEERYRILYEDNPSMYFTANTDGTVLSVNKFVMEHLGYSVKDLVGQSVLNVFHPDDREAVQQYLVACLQQQGEAVQLEARKMRKDGTVLWVRESARAVYDLNGQVVVLLICDDITERIHTQDALFASEAELRALFTSMQDAVLVIDRNGVYREIAPTNMNKSYLLPEEVVGKRLSDFFPSEQVEKFLGVIRQVLETRQNVQIEYQMKIGAHSPWFESSVSPMDADSTIWVARDISERKQVEAKLHLQSAALEAAANTIVITDRDGIIQWANSSFSSLTGFDLNEVIGKTPGELMKSGIQDKDFYKDMWSTILDGNIWHNELVNRRKDGSLYFEEMTITPLRNSDNEVSHFIAVKQDITERKRAEDALVQSEKAYRTLFENMPIGLYRTSIDGRILTANPALAAMFGYSDVLSLLEKNASELYADPELNNKFQDAVLKIGVLSAFESEYRRHDQQTFWAEDYVHIILDEAGNPLYYEGSLINITDRKKAEDDLRQANQSLQLAHSELQQMFLHEQILARTDSLTGQTNRRHFFELATREFATSIRYQRPLTIILFDIDGFKQVNDTFGHSLGDMLLLQVAQATASQVRGVDVLARYGGDEFIILLPQTTAQQAFLIAERIRESVATTRMESENSPFAITLSIGVAEIMHEPQDETIEDVIRRADQALYQAKKNGRNHTIIYEEL